VKAAAKMERAVSLSPTALYSDVKALGSTKPGDLLDQEAGTEYTFSKVFRAVRILYHSRDALDHDVATSAVILLPTGPAPDGGWPVIAWGHGTSGVATACAPSLMKDVYYWGEGLSDMVRAGFAVVATDYHGLGTAGHHQYLDKVAQARDMIYSIPAARSAVQELGRRWVADGHSQGGLAAWGVAEIESELNDDDYLGAISVSGAISLDHFMEYINGSDGGEFYLDYLAFGIQSRFPEFEPREILRPAAMSKYAAVTTSPACWYSGFAEFRGFPKGKALKPAWRRNRFVRQFVQETELGSRPIRKPLLVISGEADQTVPIDAVRQTVRKACSMDSALSFKSYPGLDHDPTMTESIRAQLAWMRERFTGIAMTNTCRQL